jgi:hypothetical protein
MKTHSAATQRQASKKVVRGTPNSPKEKSAPSAAQQTLVTDKVIRAASKDPEVRWKMISEAAYFRGERRGFAPGGELKDWFEAEAEVERVLEQEQPHGRPIVEGSPRLGDQDQRSERRER